MELVQELDHHRQHAPRLVLARGVGEDRAVDLHDVGAQPDHAVEIGAAHAEVVHGDGSSHVAIPLDRFAQQLFAGARRLEDLDAHALGRKAVVAHQLGELARAARVAHRGFRMDVDEERAVARIHRGVVAQVQRTAGPIEKRSIRVGRAGEKVFGAHHGAVWVAGANQRLESEAGLAPHAIDRLEMGAEGGALPLDGGAAARPHQAFGRVRERTAAAGAAHGRRRRLHPIPHDCVFPAVVDAGTFAGLTGHFGPAALRRGYGGPVCGCECNQDFAKNTASASAISPMR